MRWIVTTDGSCLPSGAGGWAAIIMETGKRGGQGTVVRGRLADTKSTRTELVAVVEGLRTLTDLDSVELRTDCSTILVVIERWRDGKLLSVKGNDRDLWIALGEQLDRLSVTLRMIWPGDQDPVHRRAHGFAGAEAKSQEKDLPANQQVIDLPPAKHRWRPRHLPGCEPGSCEFRCFFAANERLLLHCAMTGQDFAVTRGR